MIVDDSYYNTECYLINYQRLFVLQNADVESIIKMYRNNKI